MAKLSRLLAKRLDFGIHFYTLDPKKITLEFIEEMLKCNVTIPYFELDLDIRLELRKDKDKTISLSPLKTGACVWGFMKVALLGALHLENIEDPKATFKEWNRKDRREAVDEYQQGETDPRVLTSIWCRTLDKEISCKITLEGDFETADRQNTAFCLAAENNNVKAMETILSNLSKNQKEEEFPKALIRAAELGNVKAVQFLLSEGADVNTSDEEGHTLYSRFVLQQYINGNKEFLKKRLKDVGVILEKHHVKKSPNTYVKLRQEWAKQTGS